MEFTLIVTDLGKAKIVEKLLADDKLTFTHVAVGDDDTLHAGDAEALNNEVDRVAVNLVDTDPTDLDRINIEGVIPIENGPYWVREVGLFDEDGDLIVVGQYPPSYKPVDAEGSARVMVIRVALKISRTEAITLTTDLTTVLTTRDLLDSHTNRRDNPHEVTVAQLLPGGLINQALFKASNTSGDTEWRDVTAVAVIVDAVQEVQTLAAEQVVVTLSEVTTTGLAVYVGGARLVPGVDYVVDGIGQITLDRDYPPDTRILLVNNDPYGEVEATTSSMGLVRMATAQEIYNFASSTENFAAVHVDALGAALARMTPGKLWKSKPTTPAFGLFGAAVVTAQGILAGVGGTGGRPLRTVQIDAGETVSGISGTALERRGWWRIYYVDSLDELVAYRHRPESLSAVPADATLLGGFSHNGYDVDAIQPYSMWDNSFRPDCRQPDGMVLVNDKFWCDIWFTTATSDTHVGGDWEGYNAVPNESIATFANTPPDPLWDGEDGPPPLWLGSSYGGTRFGLQELLWVHYGKRLPTYVEFEQLARGTTEQTSRASEWTTNEHDSDWQSQWGVELVTGIYWTWGAEYFPDVLSDGPSTGGRGTITLNQAYSAFGGRYGLTTQSGSRAFTPLVNDAANVAARGIAGHRIHW